MSDDQRRSPFLSVQGEQAGASTGALTTGLHKCYTISCNDNGGTNVNSLLQLSDMIFLREHACIPYVIRSYTNLPFEVNSCLRMIQPTFLLAFALNLQILCVCCVLDAQI